MSTNFKIEGIDLGNGANKVTMVCVPAGYKQSAKANVILFLHGTGQKSAELYLGQADHALGTKLDVQGTPQDVILIVPTLSDDARGGKLGGTDADDVPSGPLKWFLPLVWAELQKQSPNPPIADFSDAGKVGKLVLAAHSGGGKVMLALARTRDSDDYTKKLAECWAFDALYGQPHSTPEAAPDPGDDQKTWTSWETKNRAQREMLWAEWLGSSGVPFFLYCATGKSGGGTGTRSTSLDKLITRRKIGSAKVIFDSTASHDGIVLPRFEERLTAFKT
jgi:hypothetical protein